MIPVIMRYTGNVAMFVGLLLAGLSVWDYLGGGPGAGQGTTLVMIGIGVAVFLIGLLVFRRMAADAEASERKDR